MNRDERAFWSLAQDKLSRGESVRYRARGQSMWPLIPDGSTLTLGPLTLDQICPGDVVLSLGSDHAAAHRVLRAPSPDTLVLGGDRHSTSEVVTVESLIARVEQVELRWLKYRPSNPLARKVGILTSSLVGRWSAWREARSPCAPHSPPCADTKPNR